MTMTMTCARLQAPFSVGDVLFAVANQLRAEAEARKVALVYDVLEPCGATTIIGSR